MSAITLERAGNSVLTLTLNRPEALNAITPDMLEALADALEGVTPDDRVIVLTGAGRAFSAGVDLKALGGRPIHQGKVGDILDVPAGRALEAMGRLAQPVIAKVNGHCFTGALELALGCDLVYVADEAKLGDTHAKWGVRPTWGMTQRLPRRIPMNVARELAFTARTFTAAEATAWGLANGHAPASELDALVDGVISRILANSADVIAAYKDLRRRTESLQLTEGLAVESARDYDISDTNDRLAEFIA